MDDICVSLSHVASDSCPHSRNSGCCSVFHGPSSYHRGAFADVSPPMQSEFRLNAFSGK